MPNKPNLNILQGRLVLETNNGFIEVHKYNGNHLIRNNGYYLADKLVVNEDPLIYIYRGQLRRNAYKLPGSIYKKSKGDYEWIPHDPDVAPRYLLSRCKPFGNIDQIIDALNDKNTEFHEVNPELVDGSSGEYFAPKIRDTDDILKRTIKTALQNMKININNLKGNFTKEYELNNMKSQLISPGKMSPGYFAKWAEVLGIEIEVIVRNRKGCNRLSDEVTIIMK